MGKILVAGTDQRTMEVLSTELEAEGHELFEAKDGHEAHELALAEQPDLIFLDPKLAVFNGYELSTMLRGDPDVPAELPIVFLAPRNTDSKALAKAGVTRCLPKRHELWELRDLLAKHLGAVAIPWDDAK